MATTSIPQRRDELPQHEAIKQEAHALALAGTQRSASTVPVPDAWKEWSHDLRRGRLSVLGGFFRFVDLLAVRDVDHGRKIALALLDLAREYVDMALPERQPVLVERSIHVTPIMTLRRAR